MRKIGKKNGRENGVGRVCVWELGDEKKKRKIGKKKWGVGRPHESGVGAVVGKGSVWKGKGGKMGVNCSWEMRECERKKWREK